MGKRALFLVLYVVATAACTQHRQPPAQTAIKFKDFQALEASIVGPAAPAALDQNCGAQCQALRQEFRYVVYVGQQIYCYWDLKKAETGTDYDALATQLENSITDDTNLTGYYKVLTRWAASFHDGHVNVFYMDPSQIEVYSSPVRLELFAPATDHERLIVTAVKEVAPLAVGEEVVAINGVPASQALDQAELDSSGSTRRMRRYFAAMRLVDALGIEDGAKSLVLKVKSNGSERDVTIARNVQIRLPTPAAPTGPTTASANTTIEAVKVLSGGIGYVRLNGFGGDREEELFNQIMDRLAQTTGLILDLRKNGGGDLSGDRFIARFANQKVVRYKRRERWADFILGQRPELAFLERVAGEPFVNWHDITVEAAGPHYAKPVVALISPFCFSACDTFSSALQDNKLATFIGEGSGGGTGTPAVFDLPVSELNFRYSVIQGQTPNGAWIEGQGTQPEVYLEPTPEDRKGKQDSQLSRALEVLTGQSLQTRDLMALNPSGTQPLDISPTETLNLQLQNLRDSDERE